MENEGTVKIAIVKKTDEKRLTVGVRTVDGTASAGEDYVALDKEVYFNSTWDDHIKEVGVEIIDDDDWEPDEDFYIEL